MKCTVHMLLGTLLIVIDVMRTENWCSWCQICSLYMQLLLCLQWCQLCRISCEF